MCGIIGVDLKNPTGDQLELINNIIIDSKIRGKHSFGFANNKEVYLNQDITKFNCSDLIVDSRLLFIAHTRYRTSGNDSQPIKVDDMILVHNGVVTQERQDDWKYQCKTDCDSELILHYLLEGNSMEKIEEVFPHISYATIILKNGELFANRNGLRPLWKSEQENGIIYASTKHILSNCENTSKVLIDYGKDKQP